MIVAGIDEAGYGPRLGPLVVSATVFQSPDGVSGEEFWQHFGEGISPRHVRGDRRLVVADSKIVYRGGKGFERLEEAVLAFLAVAPGEVRGLAELLSAVSPSTLPKLDTYPWYREVEVELPLSARALGADGKGRALKRLFKQRGFAYLGAQSEVVPAYHFNRMVQAHETKSNALFACNAKFLRDLVQNFQDQHLYVVADKHGARKRYQLLLARALPGWTVQVLKEEAQVSRYRLKRRGREVHVSFREKADVSTFPVSLASMFSKYVRELFMKLFNRYWQKLVLELKPTAGYGRDAYRFLADIESAQKAKQISSALLLRAR